MHKDEDSREDFSLDDDSRMLRALLEQDSQVLVAHSFDRAGRPMLSFIVLSSHQRCGWREYHAV